MDWLDTVMNDKEIKKTLVFIGVLTDARLIAKAQAEISFKAGQEDVCTVSVSDILEKGYKAGYDKAVDENAEGWCDGHTKGIQKVVEVVEKMCKPTGVLIQSREWQSQKDKWGRDGY